MISGNRVFPMPNVVFFAVTIRVGFKILSGLGAPRSFCFIFSANTNPYVPTKVYEYNSKISQLSKRALFKARGGLLTLICG